MTKAWPAVLALCITACPGSPPGTPDPQTAKPAPDAKPADNTDPKSAPTQPTTTGEDWLVWWRLGPSWRTRWVRVEADRATVVGEKQALVIGDGAKLWQVERADKRVKVQSCECDRDPRSEFCQDRGHMPSLGLRARPLGGLEALAIKEAATGTEYGDDMSYGLEIRGGVQARLFIQNSQSGYFCGAHGSYGSSLHVFDVALGRALEDPFKGWWKALPADLRRSAAEQIQEPLHECDAMDEESATIDTIMTDVMALDEVALALVDGAPMIVWGFSAFLPYVCSPDYEAAGGASSGLIPAAAPIGLAGPLPAALSRDLETISDAEALGYSRLTLGEPDRQAMIAAFTAVPEAPWPKGEVSDTDDAPAPASAKLEQGRKLSRAGDLPQAIALFDEALKLDAGLASAWSERGYARLRAGDLVGARTDFEKALGLEAKPSFQAAVWYNLGLLAEAEKQPDEARKAYLKSQALRDTKQVKAALEALAAKP